jgi:hypothetical protein
MIVDAPMAPAPFAMQAAHRTDGDRGTISADEFARLKAKALA